ncbi:phosphorylated carbohydrates phosphatase [Chrysochromulina tobinii]|uniref:Phosphorylated carbohydrates phosphatase n=1 Tax=Chrysochromulina tobinii TaxID=1460289 RepID=A0A0M0J5T6_9EUKA|nr:phosphorylated carbohydrates phosphatase [Chrysochromulina tobinii]|eukprot:KOO21949.1 phosphorylated carbohydrates phosphatase [Chrysochromulina sp. CCMP291]
MSRLRFNNFPLQQYGVIFKLDVMLSNAIEMHRRPWALVAAEQGMREPDDDEILRAIGMRPERAIQQTFRWTDDWGETQKLAFEHYHAKNTVLRDFDFAVADGAKEWLTLLNEYQLERPPERCVVFSDDVDDVLAGHDATAKVVAVMGGARRNGADLRIADQRVSSFEDMSLMSLRELFKGEKMR